MSIRHTSTPGHRPTLVASFLHFDLSFMLWVMLGALGIYISDSLRLSPAEKGLMVAVPVLSGSLLRIPLGILSDRIGAKRVGVGMLAFLYLPLLAGWQAGGSLPSILAVGVMLGTAGGSFAVALPLASRWYPRERQGLVMGIAAAGNSGTVIANLLAPRLADLVGWHNVLALAMVPLTVVLLTFVALAKDSPERPAVRPVRQDLRAYRQADMWWFGLIYGVTFGGYVGLSSFLPIFLKDQYALTPVVAGYLTALAALSGSLVRPLGGHVADRMGGGHRPLVVLLLAISLVYGSAALLLPLAVMLPVLILGMICLGLGNGAVFQLVPQRFGSQIGLATGFVGALGGLGGFLLPNVLGSLKQALGSYAFGFAALSLMALAAFALLQLLVRVQVGWRFAWRAPHVPAMPHVPQLHEGSGSLPETSA